MLAIKQSHIHTPAQSPKSTHNRHPNRSCAARGCGIGEWGGRGGWGARRSLERVRGSPSAWISGGEAPPARSGRKSLRRSIPRQNLEAMRRWRLLRQLQGPGQLINRRERGLGRRAGAHRRARRLPDHASGGRRGGRSAAAQPIARRAAAPARRPRPRSRRFISWPGPWSCL